MTGVPLGPAPTLARALSRVVTPHMSSPVRPVATHRALSVGGGSPPNWGSPPPRGKSCVVAGVARGTGTTPRQALSRVVPPHTPSPVRAGTTHWAWPVGRGSPPNWGSPPSTCKSCVVMGVPLGPTPTPRPAHVRVRLPHRYSPVRAGTAGWALSVGGARPAQGWVTLVQMEKLRCEGGTPQPWSYPQAGSLACGTATHA